MRRPWIVPVLVVLAIVGLVLVATAEDDPGPAPLVDVVTGEGLATRAPEGWVPGELAFDFVPVDGSVLDRWTVARACPLDGCERRSLDGWLELAPELPTFAEARAGADDSLFGLVEERRGDAWVLRARTRAAADVVLVAAFADDRDAYVACGLQLDLGGDRRLIDAIVDVCVDTARTGLQTEL